VKRRYEVTPHVRGAGELPFAKVPQLGIVVALGCGECIVTYDIAGEGEQ
jgi:hypothetical protein